MKIIHKIHLAVTIYSQQSVAKTKLTESFKDARKLAIPASRLTEAFPVFYLRLISLSRPVCHPSSLSSSLLSSHGDKTLSSRVTMQRKH